MAPGGYTRRGILATAGSAGLAGISGCLSRIRANVTHDPPEQISLSITALPADEDPASIQLARDLEEKLEAVGVDVNLNVSTERLLLRDVLFNQEFDVFVARHPGHREPDELRAMLHSVFSEEAGWQNPFGLASRSMDELVEDQSLQTGRAREETVAAIQEELLELQPFTPVATPEHASAVRSDRVGEVGGVADPLAYLRMEGDVETLRVSLLDPYITRNRNPLAVQFRTRDRLVDLLFDPMVRRLGDRYVGWLAEEWSVHVEDDRATVRLRPDLSWHDGEPVTAEDVAFTYRFLSDTSLGESDSPVPAPRFRAQTSLVETVEVVDDRTVDLQFTDCSRPVCSHALTVPILPEAQWEAQAELVQDYLTEALQDSLENPVGSGPLRFVEAEPDESVVLERFDDHFLRQAETEPGEETDSGDEADPLAPYRGGPPFERFEGVVAANARSAIENLEAGDVDLVAGPLPIDVLDPAREAEGVRVLTESTAAYYLVGFNARRHPLSNHQFRAAVARLLDREAIVAEAFDTHATPVESPVHATEFVTDRLRWDGTSAAGPFPGTDGDLDVEAARDLFREAGFRYDDGDLVAQQ